MSIMGRFFRATAGLMALTLAILAFPRTAQSQDLDAQMERLENTVRPAVVLVDVFVEVTVDWAGQQLGVKRGVSGSGWIISPDGYLVTNGHVVQDYHDANEDKFIRSLVDTVINGIERQQKKPLTNTDRRQLVHQITAAGVHKNIWVTLQNGVKYAAELKQYSPPFVGGPGKTYEAGGGGESSETGKDVAILKIEGHDLPTVHLGNSDRAKVGATVIVGGYPGVVTQHPMLNRETASLTPSFTTGRISSSQLDVKGTRVFEIDAPTWHGNSGGPVFNNQREVIGMLTFGSIDLRTGQEVQGFNFMVPVNAVKEFVGAAAVDTTHRSNFDQTWEQALDYYYKGQWKEAIDKFDESLRWMPGLNLASQLTTEAMRMKGALPPSDTSGGTHKKSPPGTLWIAAVLIVLGLTAVALMLRRRQRVKRVPVLGAEPTDGRVFGRLVVREGALRGNQFPITAKGVRIGRDPAACAIVLNEESVSREHALVVPNGPASEVVVKNLSGTNSTFVNNRAIQETTLHPGDQIKIGSCVLSFEADADAARQAANNRVFAKPN
jgi:hypothetical protein